MISIPKETFQGTVPQAGDTPDTHQRVKDHCRPECDAIESVAKGGESEEGSNDDVVKQHCGNQSGRRAAFRVPPRKPASKPQSQQGRPADTSHRQRGRFLQPRADEERHRYRRVAQERQACSEFNHCAHDLQGFHG